jgi:hypothetical protein
MTCYDHPIVQAPAMHGNVSHIKGLLQLRNNDMQGQGEKYWSQWVTLLESLSTWYEVVMEQETGRILISLNDPRGQSG